MSPCIVGGVTTVFQWVYGDSDLGAHAILGDLGTIGSALNKGLY